MARCTLLLALCALLPVAAEAQREGGLRYGDLQLGVSARADVETWFDTSLECMNAPSSPGLARVEVCQGGGDRHPQVVLVDGVLQMVRFVLPARVDVQRAISTIERRYGRQRGMQSDARRGGGGLRFWNFDVPGYDVVVSEARNRNTREVRLRLMLRDPRGGWAEWQVD